MRNWGNSLPAKLVQFLSVDEVLAIHEALVDRFGGVAGIRDQGLLESALYRPRTGYYRDLVEMAAFPAGQGVDLRARKMPTSTSNPPRAWPSPRASANSSQARRAAKTGCSSRVTEEKAAGKWARA